MRKEVYAIAKRNAKVVAAVILTAIAILATRFEAVDVAVISKDLTIFIQAK